MRVRVRFGLSLGSGSGLSLGSGSGLSLGSGSGSGLGLSSGLGFGLELGLGIKSWVRVTVAAVASFSISELVRLRLLIAAKFSWELGFRVKCRDGVRVRVGLGSSEE